ncbi:carboxylesterase/lipase family protein [Kitasatospora sp. NPDC048286]|uniref:carboxylesterase/lipase family protein n=1 Tax=Kitasatospora sp. NPDC048286 TaxID=3364047 RepID=UPI00371929E1
MARTLAIVRQSALREAAGSVRIRRSVLSGECRALIGVPLPSGAHRETRTAFPDRPATRPQSRGDLAPTKKVKPVIDIDRPVVGTESGRVQGAVEDGVAAFRGIPYAASPVAELRFAAPQRPPTWSGVREATYPGPSVPQGPNRLAPVMGYRKPDWNEDGCLTVNVWTTHLPHHGSDRRPRPVLLWIHGTGFTTGSAGWNWYDGLHLAAAGDIVVVSANYRLGALGYIYLPEAGVENLGVQDQTAVISWVRRNIAAFGGDPGNLTVGGQSAGANAALYHALSPVTGPLFHQVIAQSGIWAVPPQRPEDAVDNARRYLDILGLTGKPDPVAALRAVPVEQLIDAFQQLFQEVSVLGSLVPAMYPVLGSFGMPQALNQALADGRLDGKRLLIGMTRNEMSALFALDPVVQALTAAQARAVAGRLAADGAERFDHAAALHPGATPAEILTEVDTDIQFRDGALAIADHHAAARNPVHLYQFDYTPVPTPTDWAHRTPPTSRSSSTTSTPFSAAPCSASQPPGPACSPATSPVRPGRSWPPADPPWTTGVRTSRRTRRPSGTSRPSDGTRTRPEPLPGPALPGLVPHITPSMAALAYLTAVRAQEAAKGAAQKTSKTSYASACRFTSIDHLLWRSGSRLPVRYWLVTRASPTS